MTQFLLFIAIIIFTCVFLNNASFRIGVPVLLAFMVLGMLFGNGALDIGFNDLDAANSIASAALIFIMFYGGFGTKWSASKGVAKEAALLATVGVVITACITGLLCHYAFHWDWHDALMMGAVISSTDAASVFSILRSRKLALKNGSVPLLEIESGSNDPCSYMLTIVMVSMFKGGATAGSVIWILFSQLGFGALAGWLISKFSIWMIDRIKFATAGFDSLFMMAIAIFAYTLPAIVGGNGYLSAYIVGIALGNHNFANKKEMVHFFDGITGPMQVIIFFMLGLLAHPAQLGQSLLPAVMIFIVLLVVARPATLALILWPFKKYGFKQQVLLSVCGLRGAASIVFAIVAIVGVGAGSFHHDIFNIVFCIVLLSIGLQGSFIPWVAKKLDMIDDQGDVMKTFNDFADDVDLQFTEFKITASSAWKSKSVKELGLPKEVLFCLIERADGQKVVPNGYTVLQEGDTIMVCSKSSKSASKMQILEHQVGDENDWAGKQVKELPVSKSQIVLIQRGDSSIIPHGSTVICRGDILFINKSIK